MSRTGFVVLLLMLAVSCGKQTTMSLEDIRFRLDTGLCRARMEKTAFLADTWEFHGGEPIESESALRAALPESLTVCPVTLEPYRIDTASGVRTLVCPSGHGSVVLSP